jgi:hypothetical protein
MIIGRNYPWCVEIIARIRLLHNTPNIRIIDLAQFSLLKTTAQGHFTKFCCLKRVELVFLML